MKQSAHAMVLASFLGDSLALGAHWIYDTKKISSEFGRITGLIAPAAGSYHPHRGKGQFTHYGDQTLLLLQSLAWRGTFDLHTFAGEWQTMMQSYDGYLDKASKATLENMAAGKDRHSCGSASTDLGGPARIAPLVYLYRDNLPALRDSAREQTALTHNAPAALAGADFLARFAYEVLHQLTPREAIHAALEEGIADIDLDLRIRKALDSSGEDSQATVAAFGQACGISAALPGALHLILKYQDNLAEALIENVMAGGDSAGRGLVVGMILGALLGEKALPAAWLRELTARQEIETALQALP